MMLALIIATVLFLSPPLQVVAQVASSSWRKPNITIPRADRVSLAEAGLQMAIGFLDNSNALFPDPGDTYGNSGQFYSQLAEFDLATNQTKYRETLQQYFQLANETLAEQFGAPNFTGALNFGHAAAIAYMTYNDSQFLTYAKQSWSAGRLYTISQDDLASGKIPGKDFPLTTTCDGLTMAGGTFHAKNVTDSGIVGLSTGGFLILSALLAEATPEDKLYLEAAEESASFIRDHLYNANNVVQDEISASCQGNVGNVTVLESHNSGLMIEGLAILYSLTHNDSIHDLVGEIVTTAMENTEWQGPDGILASGAYKEGDLFLPRGLAAAYTRNATTPTLQESIKDYLSVQFNAVVDLATTNESNIYGASWTGPASSTFSGGNQTTALQVLISAINLHNQTVTSNASDTGSRTPPIDSAPATSSPRRPSRTAAILGGSIGGVVLLVGAMLGAILWRRSRKRRAQRHSVMSIISTPSRSATIVPFDLETRFRSTDAPVSIRRSGQPTRTRSAQWSAAGGRGSTTWANGMNTTSAERPERDLALRYQVRNDAVDEEEELPDYSDTGRMSDLMRSGKN